MGKYLFSARGRVNRARFWLLLPLAVAALLANAAAIVLFEHYAYGHVGVPTHWDIRVVAICALFLPAYAILLFAAAMIGIKRLHDRGKSGIWLAIIVFAPLLAFASDDSAVGSSAVFSAAVVLLGFAVWVWGFVELGVLPGTDGNNVYGDDPLLERG